MSTEIQSNDLERLKILKAAITKGQAVFFIVGAAMAEIKERELYKLEGHKTFADFCELEWGFGKRYSNQLIMDSKVINELPAEMRELITTEKAARELGKIPAMLRPAVIASIKPAVPKGSTKQPIITAANIRKAVPAIPQKLKPAVPTKPQKPKSPVIQLKEIQKDETGLEIPDEILPLWNRAHEVQELLTYLSAVRGKVKKFQTEKDKLFVRVNFTTVLASIDQAFIDLKVAKPYAVCPSCQGRITAGCTTCGETGLISQFFWDSCVPNETKEMRAKITGVEQ